MKEIKLIVSAGYHDRQDCPVSILVSKEEKNNVLEGTYGLADEGGVIIPVQLTDQGDQVSLSFLVTLKAGECRTYTLIQQDNAVNGVEFVQKENKIDVLTGSRFFTSYVYDPMFAKPYLGPVMGTYNQPLTRLDFNVREHPHQRSVWMGIGDVNGIDFWNEIREYGKQKQTHINCTAGSVSGVIDSEKIWTDFTGRPVMDESAKLVFYHMPTTGRYLDIESTFKASYGETVFGPTKEAGPLGIRVAETINVSKGGTMINAYGAVGEAECWGKRAHWCDYCGLSNRQLSGIAVYDHPENDGYPTYWHIRNYGLFAPNNFYFTGSRTLEEGESVTYRYRIYFHDGDTVSAQVKQRYHDYINPPKIEII